MNKLSRRNQWSVWFPVNKTIDWLNIPLINLYYYDVDSALVGMNSGIQGFQILHLILFLSGLTIQLSLSQVGCSSPLPLRPSLSSFYFWFVPWPPRPYWKRKHQVLKKRTEDRLTHHGSFVNWNQKNGKNTENGRWRETWRLDSLVLINCCWICLRQRLSIRDDFAPQGTLNNVWRHFLVVTAAGYLVDRGQGWPLKRLQCTGLPSPPLIKN